MIDHTTTPSLPRQKLPRSKKTKEWGIDNINYFIRSATSNLQQDTVREKINYDLYNNIINKDDFTYVTNPYGLKEEFPARLNNYNIITPKLKLLEGEEIKRPFNFRVVAVNSDAVSQMQEKRKQMLMQYLEAELIQGLIEQGVQVQNPDTGEVMTPPEIEKYLTYSDADIRESVANKLAKYLIKKENLEYKFNMGFKDSLIVAKEIYYIGIEGGDVVCHNVNPLDFSFILGNSEFFQDGQAAVETKFCTPSEVIDAYFDELTPSEIDSIESKGVKGVESEPLSISFTNKDFSSQSNSGEIPVTRVEWKSLRKIGFLTYYDENLEKQETIVDESYKINEESGETIEWAWINEVWEGTKIGASIYTKIKPKTVQYRSIDNPSICKLGYVGCVSNNRNSVATSLVDLTKHHQYLYNIIMYRMEFEIAKAKGKKMVMDVAQIPRSQGIDIEKWMYYFDSMGIAFVNSFEEGKGQFAGQVSAFNQFTAIDMSLSQSVGQYISILDKIETMASDLMGVSRQRQGSVSSSETVGGVERSVVQSSHITEPLFYLHNEVKKQVITQLVECAKVAYPEGKKINYILDDMGRTFLEISEDFVDADYGVFVTNTAKEVQALEQLRSIAQQAVASGIISLKELISVFDTDSIADIKNVVEKAELNAQAKQEREYESQQQLVEQQSQAAMELEAFKADRLDQREMIKGQNQKEVAIISALGFSENKDSDNNGVPDVLEVDKLRQEAKQHQDDVKLKNRELDIKEKDIEANKQIAKSKKSN